MFDVFFVLNYMSFDISVVIVCVCSFTGALCYEFFIFMYSCSV